ncbi:hypothetical protein QM467_06145 [Rhodoblastus sp. 17X3]|uniref:hypothetical protein n=1 Tax=Rhodoblastus sp. 17X3 TaxID=3047026 RepID=UPI0024B68899|nr:hypothetical protein [Rhodoblastus sp. 17X3]MDI9847641.1 hypothetical protein [Rhodoblastus sp. 17X3]
MNFPNIDLKMFDHYSRNARIYPAVIGAAPAIAALMILFTWRGVSLTSSVASAGLLVVLYAMSDLARQWGKRLEPKLYARLGGMPSVRMLRRNDDTFDEGSKERYRVFLAGKLGRPVPTAEEEAHNQQVADAFYAAAGSWLRENTRDTKKFSILFNENVTYGFRRNLLGLRWPAAALNFIVCAICIALLWPVTWPLNMADDLTVRVVIVLLVALIHGLYLVLVVTWRAAGDAANSYGRQLILTSEAFLTKPGPAQPKRARKAATSN